MTTPPDDFENDPTGIRDLLRSLPDPGPMPDDVADRITAALAQEQAGRSDADRGNVTPLTHAARPARGGSGGRRWMQAVGGLVAAAAVAAVAVVGVNALQHDNAPTSAVPSGSAPSSVSGDKLVGRMQVESTGTDYTPASFNAQAASMAAGSASSKPNAGLVTEFGSLATPSSLLACARSIGGSLLNNPSDIKVDLATFEGRPAVVIVVTNQGQKTAFAVSSTCSKGDEPYAAPRTI